MFSTSPSGVKVSGHLHALAAWHTHTTGNSPLHIGQRSRKAIELVWIVWRREKLPRIKPWFFDHSFHSLFTLLTELSWLRELEKQNYFIYNIIGCIEIPIRISKNGWNSRQFCNNQCIMACDMNPTNSKSLLQYTNSVITVYWTHCIYSIITRFFIPFKSRAHLKFEKKMDKETNMIQWSLGTKLVENANFTRKSFCGPKVNYDEEMC
jgi:hypothetical protein